MSFRCTMFRCSARTRTRICVQPLNSHQGVTEILKRSCKPQARSVDGVDGSPIKRSPLKPVVPGGLAGVLVLEVTRG